jgi:predicted pyridoxine 5'-phosphate oxidase superfamily flavin-nucleotide-binding protein
MDDGIKYLIENNALALSSVDSEGRPHNIAVACCKVVNDKIVISNSHIYETIKNLEVNKNVSLAVWHKDWEEVSIGFEIKGIADNFTNGEWFDFVKKLPDNDDYDIKSAIIVTVVSIKKLLS